MTPPIFDRETIAELDRSVGANGRNALLNELADRTEMVRATLRRLIGSGDFKAARQAALSLRHAAVRVGAFRLVDCLLQVELYTGAQVSEDVFAAKLDTVFDEFVEHARYVTRHAATPNAGIA